MSNYSTYKGANNITLDVTNRDGTGSMIAPKGTTAQRPAATTTGQLRYNTTLDALEQYTSVGWAGISPPPTISSISPTTYSGEQGTTITVNGTNFTAGAVVKFITSGSVEYSATTTTFVNATQLTATTPQDFTVADEPLSVKVINPNNLSVIASAVLDCGGTPTWTTASGSIGSATCNNAASGLAIAATDPDSGGTIASYAIASGTLPSGLSLNTSTGAITGTAPAVVSSTVYSFTGRATDNAGNTSDRSFNITIAPTTGSVAGINSSDTGGSSWFDHSSAYYGVEHHSAYQLTAGEKVNRFFVRETTTNSNVGMWFIVFEQTTTTNLYKIVAAWKFVYNGAGSSAIKQLEAASATATVGTLLTDNVFITPNTATYGNGNYYVGWTSADSRNSSKGTGTIYTDKPESDVASLHTVNYKVVSDTAGYPDQVGVGAGISLDQGINTGSGIKIGFYGT